MTSSASPPYHCRCCCGRLFRRPHASRFLRDMCRRDHRALAAQHARIRLYADAFYSSVGVVHRSGAGFALLVGPEVWLAGSMLLLCASYVAVRGEPVVESPTVAAVAPSIVRDVVADSQGALVLVENNWGLNMIASTEHRSEKRGFDVNYEALLPGGTRRLYADAVGRLAKRPLERPFARPAAHGWGRASRTFLLPNFSTSSPAEVSRPPDSDPSGSRDREGSPATHPRRHGSGWEQLSIWGRGLARGVDVTPPRNPDSVEHAGRQRPSPGVRTGDRILIRTSYHPAWRVRPIVRTCELDTDGRWPLPRPLTALHLELLGHRTGCKHRLGHVAGGSSELGALTTRTTQPALPQGSKPGPVA